MLDDIKLYEKINNNNDNKHIINVLEDKKAMDKQAFKTIPMPKDPVLIKGIFDSSALNTLVCLKTQV